MVSYSIGDVNFIWNGNGYHLDKGVFFDKFKVEGMLTGECIRFEGVFEPLEPYGQYEMLEGNMTYELYLVNGERFLIYHWHYCRFAFGMWVDRIDYKKTNYIYFNPKILKESPMTDDWFFGLTGFDKTLLQIGAPILHASYIDVEGSAVLFTAPSQTGKSTQASLWNQHESAKIINGDRVLMRKRGLKWHAFGYPSCGSSGVCENSTLPIRAIVVLEQGKENKIVKMTASEKIKELTSGMELYSWDKDSLYKALELSEDIANEMEIVKLICRPDEESVRVLKRHLEEKKEW